MNERKLADGYKWVVIKLQPDPNGASMTTQGILMPSGVVVPEAEAPDHCFAPEPQEFREGDLIRVCMTYPASHKEFLRVIDPKYSRQFIFAIDGGGTEWVIAKEKAKLIEHCPSTPTGPPVVGSYVGGKTSGRRGIVRNVRAHPRRPYGINWNDGSGNWYMADELIHIASPKEIT